MTNEKRKKGAITANTLITIILLIIGFVLLLFIFYQINWTGQIDREVCHQSVILRATLPSVGQELVPLKCKTSKFCVTSGIIGGKCENTFSNSKEVSKVKVTKEEQVEKLISQEIISCWSTMGEGKVSLFSQYWAETFGIGGVYPTCVICSRIAFDDNLKVDLEDMNVLEYMQTHKIPDGEVSYYDYLAGEGGRFSVEDLESFEIKNIDEIESDGDKEIDVTEESIATLPSIDSEEWEDPLENSRQEIAILFMQISAPGHGDSLLNLGKAVLGIGAAGAYFAGPSLTIKAIKGVGLKGGLIALGAAIVGTVVQQVNVAHNRGVTGGYCGDISVGAEARNGCSVVRAINYNETEILKYCSVIESIS